VNGYDLNVDSLCAHRFMSDALAKRKFRFSLILDRLNAHVANLS
jgi:hypothetical protein